MRAAVLGFTPPVAIVGLVRTRTSMVDNLKKKTHFNFSTFTLTINSRRDKDVLI